MKDIVFLTPIVLFLFGWSEVATSKVSQNVQNMAKQQCAACHGAKGISSNPQWPNLAGQKKRYLILQLKAFRSGERKNSLMNPQAQMLSDEQIQGLAQYYSQLNACPKD